MGVSCDTPRMKRRGIVPSVLSVIAACCVACSATGSAPGASADRGSPPPAPVSSAPQSSAPPAPDTTPTRGRGATGTPTASDPASPIGSATGSRSAAPTPTAPARNTVTHTTVNHTAPNSTAPRRALQYPGGRSGREVLTAQHRLDPQGRLRFGTSGVTDPATGAALCGYLFGTPDQVKGMTILPGRVTLDTFSGFQYDADGSTFECAYDVDGEPMLEMQVTDRHLDPNSPGRPVIVTHAGLQASLSYRPDYTGSRLSHHLAQQWLLQAVSMAVR